LGIKILIYVWQRDFVSGNILLELMLLRIKIRSNRHAVRVSLWTVEDFMPLIIHFNRVTAFLSITSVNSSTTIFFLGI